MKLSQIAIAVFTTTLVIFAWSFIYWEFINPQDLIYQSQNISADLESLLTVTKSGTYVIGSQSMPGLKGWLVVGLSEHNIFNIIIKSLSTSFMASLFACIFVLVANLHLYRPSRRFFALIMVGSLYILLSFLPTVYSEYTQWDLIFVHLIFDSVLWIIIAISLAVQAGVKKRNIFLEK